jgi:hypothetical protein
LIVLSAQPKINLEPVWSNVEAKMPDSACSRPSSADLSNDRHPADTLSTPHNAGDNGSMTWWDLDRLVGAAQDQPRAGLVERRGKDARLGVERSGLGVVLVPRRLTFRTIDTLLILYPHRTMQATTDR